MKELIKVVLLIDIYLIFSWWLFINLYYYPFFGNQLLIFELAKKSFNLPVGVIFFCSCLNIFLLHQIIKQKFSPKVAFLSAFLYSISSWTIYLGFFNSVYILCLFWLLLFSWSTQLKNKLGNVIPFVAILGGLITSFFLWIVFPGLFLLILVNSPKKQVAVKYLLVFFLAIFLLIIVYLRSLSELKVQTLNQIGLFQNIASVALVNKYQGEDKMAGIGNLGQVSDNRYSYFLEYFIYNLLVHFFPVTYFTPDFSLLSFSYSPPILFGFLLPTLVGLKEVIIKLGFKNFLIIFLSLILPSVLSEHGPDLNKLVLVSPLIFLLIGVGVAHLWEKKAKVLLGALILLVVFQQLMVISDIYLREPLRINKVVQKVYGHH